MKELNYEEMQKVSGGWFFLALPIVIGGGYTYGKDRAIRDNKREELKKKEEQKKNETTDQQ